MDVTWSRITQYPLHIHPLNNDAVVYHTGSGATHWLDELSIAILEALPPEPCELQTLASRIGELTGLENDQELSEAIELRLSELAKYAIVKHHSGQ